MRYRNIIIAPHIDDAFFSLGGLMLSDRGKKQKVVDVFSISGFQKLKLANKKETTKMRRDEELANARKLGVAVDFLPFIDREEKQKESEVRLERRITKRLRKYLEEGDRIFFPLAITAHADHVLVSRIGLRLLRSAKDKIYFYEDLPYAMKTTGLWRLIRLFVNYRNSSPNYPLINTEEHTADLERIFVRFSPLQKLALCRTYRSQTTLRILASIMYYGFVLGFRERLWKVRNYFYAELLTAKKVRE
jgi:LmbE family N-acetylglucosaminyl deacetylase